MKQFLVKMLLYNCTQNCKPLHPQMQEVISAILHTIKFTQAKVSNYILSELRHAQDLQRHKEIRSMSPNAIRSYTHMSNKIFPRLGKSFLLHGGAKIRSTRKTKLHNFMVTITPRISSGMLNVIK